MKFIRSIYDWMGRKSESKHGIFWLVTLFFIESSFFIIPVDPLLILFCIKQRQKSLYFALLATVASVLGGLFGYLIGAALWDTLGKSVVTWIISEQTFAKVVARYKEHEVLFVLLGGFTPIPYKAITISAGFCKLPLLPFILCSIVARAGRFYLVAGAIYVWGESIKTFIDKYFNYLVVIFTVIVVLSCSVLKGDSMIALEVPSIKRIEGIAQSSPEYISFAQGALRIGGVDENTKEYARQILLTDKADYYNDALGFLPLRNRLALFLGERYGTRMQPANIMITHGGVGGLTSLALTLLTDQHEVLLLEPSYPVYRNIVKLAKATPVFVNTSRLASNKNGALSWTFDQDSIERACTAKTRMIMLSNPSNPCGTVLSHEQLYRLAAWCEQRKIYLVVDEVYDDYVFEGNFTSSTPLATNMDYVVRVGSFSKNFGMSGWRLGFVAANKELITAMAPVQVATISCPTMVSQYAGLFALEHHEVTSQYAAVVKKSRDLICDFFDRLQGSGIVRYARPEAGFYLFFDTMTEDSTPFVMDILEKVKVAMTPGGDFGPDYKGFVRLCFARDPEVIQQGIARLQSYFSQRQLTLAAKAKEQLSYQ